jgi:hypothetical protein
VGRGALRGRGGGGVEKAPFTTLAYDDPDLTKEGAADAFNDCFIKKIEALIEKIPDAKETDPFLGRRKRADRKNLAFSLTTVSVGEVTKIILGLKNLKATGVDGIPTSILKEGVEVLALPITWIINQSIETGTFPKKWKESIVVPILKKGNPRTMKNYRPVSNLCTTSKVLETVVMRHLSNFFEKNKLLPENQHGFRRNRSMVTAITSLDSIWAKLRAGGDCIGVTAFDLSAAFDIVPHDLLMRKMEVYGVTEKESSWIWSFLSDRTQRIRWGKSLSSPRAVPFGTPQGSCLSPLLFLIYTADLEEYLKKECANSYADDTTTFIHGKKEQDVRRELEEDAVNLLDYMAANLLVANPDKTQFMVVNGRKDGGPIKVGNTDIVRSEEVELLGMKVS